MPTFDRFDICEAYALYADHYNVGGYATGRKYESPELAERTGDIWTRLSRIGFRPAPCFPDRAALPPLGLTENGQAIYDALVARKGF